MIVDRATRLDLVRATQDLNHMLAEGLVGPISHADLSQRCDALARPLLHATDGVKAWDGTYPKDSTPEVNDAIRTTRCATFLIDIEREGQPAMIPANLEWAAYDAHPIAHYGLEGVLLRRHVDRPGKDVKFWSNATHVLKSKIAARLDDYASAIALIDGLPMTGRERAPLIMDVVVDGKLNQATTSAVNRLYGSDERALGTYRVPQRIENEGGNIFSVTLGRKSVSNIPEWTAGTVNENELPPLLRNRGMRPVKVSAVTTHLEMEWARGNVGDLCDDLIETAYIKTTLLEDVVSPTSKAGGRN